MLGFNTAGTGITHSEFNPSGTEPVHLLQIWIFPDRKGYRPGYQQRRYADEEKAGKWRLAASRRTIWHTHKNMITTIKPFRPTPRCA